MKNFKFCITSRNISFVFPLIVGFDPARHEIAREKKTIEMGNLDNDFFCVVHSRVFCFATDKKTNTHTQPHR